MPRYEFDCKHCATNFTVAISIAERDKVKCPNCGSKNIKQKFTPVSIGGTSCKPNDCGSCGSQSFG